MIGTSASGYVCDKHERASMVEGAECSECYREKVTEQEYLGEKEQKTPESSRAVTNQPDDRCPFCGGGVHLSEWAKSKLVTDNGHICPEVWFVGCENTCFFVKHYAHHGTKEDALAKWRDRLPNREKINEFKGAGS